MSPLSPSLIKVLDKLSQYGAVIHADDPAIKIDIDITEAATDLSKIRPLLYLILNKFEERYFILITGIPFCLLPGTPRHIDRAKRGGADYIKEKGCQKCLYNKHCPGWPKDHKIDPLPQPVNDLPGEVAIEITKQCNLHCLLCFSTNSAKEMSLSAVKTIIDECAQLGIEAVRFSGGEPLLHKDIVPLLRYAKDKGLYVILNTNATVLNIDTEGTVRNCVDNVLASLQGFDADSDKYITNGSSDFKAKLRHIARLNTQVPMMRVGTIISQTLLSNFDKYWRLLKKLGIQHWELFRPMIPDRFEEYAIEKEDYTWLIDRVKTLKQDNFDAKIASPLPFCIYDDLAISRYTLVGAHADDGHNRVVCDVDGFFKPDYFIKEDLGKKVAEAWQDPFLKNIRSLDYLPSKCRDCSCLHWCKGGSRSLAKAATGDYFGLDPLMEDAHDPLQNSLR